MITDARGYTATQLEISLTPALRKLLELLLLHRIEVHALASAVTVDGRRFEPGSAYVVPAVQPQFRLVHSIFADTPQIMQAPERRARRRSSHAPRPL